MGNGKSVYHFIDSDGPRSSAFDTVDHDILLTILRCKFGLEHEALKWFDRYLHPNSYKVIVNGKYSREIDLSVSVPQGSCAGANIFNLYCAPLHEEVDGPNVVKNEPI